MYRLIEGQQDLMPREKASTYGIKKLSDSELLSVLLGCEAKTKKNSLLISRVLLAIDKSKDEDLIENLVKITGIGPGKATLISSAIEFSRRKLTPNRKKVSYPTDILPAVRHYVTREQEYFITVCLNGAQEIIQTNLISIGIVNRTLIHPREVFADAILTRSASIILCHNHPSGNLDPSPEDLQVTEKLVEAGELLGIKVLDHIIFSDNNYYSFTENSKI